MGPSVGAGVVLISPEGGKFRYAVHLHFPASNNVTEYETLVNDIRIAINIGETRLYVYGDSKLVVDQVMKDSNCESPLMDAYCQEVQKLEGKFWGLDLHQISRKENLDANALAKMAAERKPVPSGVFVNHLNTPSDREKPPTADVTSRLRLPGARIGVVPQLAAVIARARRCWSLLSSRRSCLPWGLRCWRSWWSGTSRRCR
jgi:ribonuclease HI